MTVLLFAVRHHHVGILTFLCNFVLLFFLHGLVRLHQCDLGRGMVVLRLALFALFDFLDYLASFLVFVKD